MMAAHYGHEAMVRMLLDRGARINQAREDGGTPLYMAAQQGHAAVAQVLLDRGADINQAWNDGATPLYMAAQQGHAAFAQVLLDRGADINQAANDGSTPLFMTSQQGYEAVAQVLLDRGADINQAWDDGSTPLYMAAQQGHNAVVRLLLDRGAHINNAQNQGSTPLYMAAKNGHDAVVQLLLDRGADVNKGGDFGTPLHGAAGEGHPRVIELLLRRGANPKAKDRENDIPVINATLNKQPLCIAALQPRTIACLRPWSAKTAAAFPLPFRLAIAVLLRQVSHQAPPAIAPDPAREAPFNLGRTRGVPMCPVTNAATGETRDVDLLQELILNNGLIDADWFSIDPKKRLRRWLLPARRLALRQWEAGDTVEVRGLKSASELNGRMAVIKAYLPNQRRFECELVAVAESRKPAPPKKKGKRKKKGEKKKAKKPKPVALRAENLVVRFCKACGKHGTTKLQACGACRLAHYCGAGCQKAAWRGHKAFCKFAQKEAKKSNGPGRGRRASRRAQGQGQGGKACRSSGGVGIWRSGRRLRPGRQRGAVGESSARRGQRRRPRACEQRRRGEPVRARGARVAADAGDLKKLKRLLASGADIEEVDRRYTALGVAALNGQEAVVKFLLGMGADVNHACEGRRWNAAVHGSPTRTRSGGAGAAGPWRRH